MSGNGNFGISPDDVADYLDPDTEEAANRSLQRIAALRGQQRYGQIGMMPGLGTSAAGKDIADSSEKEIGDTMRSGPEASALKLALGRMGVVGKVLPAQTRADALKYGIDTKDTEFYAKLAQAKLLAQQHEDAQTKRTAMTVYGGDKADKAGEAFYNDMSPYKNPKLNVLQQNIDRGDAVDALLKQGPNGLTQAQQAEAAQGVARLIGGSGRIAQQQIEHMIPKTLWQDTQKLWEYLSNNPQILANKDFMDIMGSTLQREKAISQQKIYAEQESSMSAHANYIRTHTDDAARTARMFGHQIPDEYFTQGAPQAPQSPVRPPPGPPRALPHAVNQIGTQANPALAPNKAAYDALPAGSWYTGPSGKKAQKPQ